MSLNIYNPPNTVHCVNKLPRYKILNFVCNINITLICVLYVIKEHVYITYIIHL